MEHEVRSRGVGRHGKIWNFARDSPAAIIAACKQSVRRWRLRRVAAVLPHLVPSQCDIGALAQNATVLVDIGGEASRLVNSKARRQIAKDFEWDPKWRGDLASARSGGQWPQVRRAKLVKGEFDKCCQLCKKEIGTLSHQFVCTATRPTTGWPAPPKDASLARGRLSEERIEVLQYRGLLVVRVPAPPVHEGEWFEWLLPPPGDDQVGDYVWYMDGSLLHSKWDLFRSTGFGIVVTAGLGLVAYGRGVPPVWCTTAAAAEAWALRCVLASNVAPPRMRTYCQSLLHIAAGGLESATLARRPLARLWGMIGNLLDGDLGQLICGKSLLWQPAHQSRAAVGVATLSDGKLVSWTDWRANRLADALAKSAAGHRAMPISTERFLKSATAAARHAAGLLGAVTHAANNHVVQVVDDQGRITRQVCRDAEPRPSGPRPSHMRAAPDEQHSKLPQEPLAVVSEPQEDVARALAWIERLERRHLRAQGLAAKKEAARREHTRRRKAEQAAVLMRHVAQLQGRPAAKDAQQRLRDLLQRVRERCGAGHESRGAQCA